ncbi:ATP-grasp peptide maturase system methyltransferase [Streptomyces sp. NBC_00091]|uniref:ATP-grasp peptide maturase system methyltransferase n=1 Tax=Streptomyces sp. NBC_00091 TaxID=2975648 RepID=UPI0022585CEE|nr:ATP-grasp peptide maturase system methyltransferase [Streptomyces sp. NBC_00091]MCX5381139.1 ATP-grasp peptide maturase system methyltransferase [Streptomyces sp. NBC_00091]
MSEEAQELRLRLARSLAVGGDLRTQPWREAVEAVPRHEFLRGGFFDRIDGHGPTAWTPVMPETPRWMERCYEDESLVTQVAGTVVPGDLRGEITRAPTSSSTMPGLVVRMWEDLQVEDGHRVLEVGTGTGYSTALGCHRLGDELVTSIEVDSGVSGRAGTALAQVGHHPDLIVGDGLAGHARGAPYDRVIATCGLVSLPYAWVEQTRPGGIILATLGGWMFSSELARLTVNQDGTASGRLLGGQVSFMLARPQSPPPLGLLPDVDQGDLRTAALGADVLNDWDTRFVAQLAAPRAQRISLDRHGCTEQVLVDVEAGSWAALTEADDGRWTVRQGGPDRIWDHIEEYVTRWRSDGAPALDRFEITITPDRQTITWPSR